MKVKKYNEFILENYDKSDDTRGKEVDFGNDIIGYLNETVPWYMDNIDNIKPIYRGLEGSRYWKKDDKPGAINYKEILEISPSKHYRVAKNTSNYYIDLLDNSPFWEEYPKRSESIICTTDSYRAENYGRLYRVIPLTENSKFAICSDDDVFTSFDYLMDKIWRINGEPDMYINGFNTWLKETFNLPNEISYDKMLIKFENIIKHVKDNNITRKHEFDYYAKELKHNFITDLNEWMSPINNKFSLLKYNRDTTEDKINSFREVYTDENCIMVLESSLQKAIKANNEIN